MKHEVLDPVGARVTDIDIDIEPLDARDIAQLRTLLADHGVIMLADQPIDDTGFVGFLKEFGPLAFTKGELHVDGHPDLNVVSNVGRATPPTSNYHVDTSYIARPPAYTALRAVTIPARGGATLFTNQYRAYDTLPDAIKARLEGRVITHVATGVELDDHDQTAALHPVFRPHPVTGRIALYLSTVKRCAAISGMDDDETAQTVADLLAHSTRDENTYRHAWAPGDIVMWDNSAVLHKADHVDVVGDRVMHRGMVDGYAAR